MTVPMENTPSMTPREITQRLYSKNVELEKKLRKSAHSKIPPDPIKWRQIRQNYETVLLTDSDFSESHDVEHALWQLHYRCIEEFRAQLRTASLASAGSVQANGGETYVRRESKTEILSFFKSFLTEATGFYHDLILKVKAKHGFPLDHISDSIDDEVSISKDDKESVDKRKGLMSCHRSLIYLGDLARYTELYGEGDLNNRNYAVASSYYTQASSLCPRSGNPHHQLAILASYLGEELMIVYRYFRSLAVESPCSTARDNLIILFEKNRQSYSQIPLEFKPSAIKMVNSRSSGRGRGRGEAWLLGRVNNKEGSNYKEKAIGSYKNFCIKFVRLNGILFTRTSLETFAEVFSSVLKDLDALLSSGTEEELNFGSDVTENVLMVVRLISILIFTVHNVKDSEGQSYADILQRSVLLQNAFVSAFEFMGHIMQRCIQLKAISSSFLLPSVLIFLEWLACHLDIASRMELEEKQAAARSFFWKHCISFLNTLIEDGYAPEESSRTDVCFYDSSTYDENEPGGRAALPEDFELRGFLPLQAAHLILDFSKNPSHFTCGSDRGKSRRVQRILAAGRSLISVAQVEREGAYFDHRLKRFAIGAEPKVSEEVIPTDLLDAAKTGNTYMVAEDIETLPVSASNGHFLTEVEEEDEVIVFKPAVAEKRAEVNSIMPFIDGDLLSAELSSKGGLGASLSPHKTYDLDARTSLAPGKIIEDPHQFNYAATGSWFLGPQTSPVQNVADARIPGNGLQDAIGVSHRMEFFHPSSSGDLISAGELVNQVKVSEAVVSSMMPKLDPVMFSPTSTFGLPSQLSSLPAVPKKNSVNRPVRHIGPPPGFGPMQPKPLDQAKNELVGNDVPLLIDDYSWLDVYGLPSAKGIEQNVGAAQTNHHYGPDNYNWNAMTAFPFPGKQLPSLQFEMESQKRHPSQLPEQVRFLHGQPPPQLQRNVLMNRNQPAPLPEQNAGSSLWSNQFIV